MVAGSRTQAQRSEGAVAGAAGVAGASFEGELSPTALEAVTL